MRDLGWPSPAAVAAAGFVMLAGCVGQAPPVRLAERTPVAVAYAFDAAEGNAALAVPDALRERVSESLTERNLAGRELGGDPWREVVAAARDTPRRLAETVKRGEGAKLVLLVELEADYSAQLSGRYAWRVYAKLTVADPRAVAMAVTEQVELPAMMQFRHEREVEAVKLVAPLIADRVSALLDAFLRGRSEFPRASGARAAASSPTPAPAATPASAGGRGSDLIYFVLVDRFRDGVAANNIAVNKADPAAWHGGDLQGVIAELDYLAGLGVGTVWLSPVFQARSEAFDGNSAFHGYWVQDLRAVDARFGGMPALKALIEAAHARHMRVLVDMVVNHVAFGAPLVREHPEWFHDKGGVNDWGSRHELEEHEVHGLPDLAQERPPVFEYLATAAEQLIIEARPDGFRLDAVKHVPLDFWRRFNARLRAAGGPEFTLLGEMYDGGPEVLSAVFARGAFSHLFDFPLAFALRDVVCKGASVGALGSVLFADREYADAGRLVTFLDNHDLPRLLSMCSPERAKLAVAALFLLRGTPALTYGTEAGLAGEREPSNRGDMRFPPGGDPGLYEHIRALARLRAAHPALAHGTTRIVGFDGNVLALAREAAGELLLVAMNNRDLERGLPLAQTAGGACQLRDLETGATTSAAAARISASSYRVWSASAAACSALVPTSSAREVELVARGATTPELLLAGSGVELGRWDPARALRLSPKTDGSYAARTRLPTGGLFAYKLVGRDAGGGLHWEQGDDRYLFVADAREPLRLSVQARALQ